MDFQIEYNQMELMSLGHKGNLGVKNKTQFLHCNLLI